MKIPNFVQNFVLNNQEVRTRVNKEIAERVEKGVDVARQDWALGTAEKLDQIIKDRPLGRRKTYTSSTSSRENITQQEQDTNYAHSVLYNLYSSLPGSIQSINQITSAVVGGGYVIEQTDNNKRGMKNDLKRLIKFFDQPNPDETIEMLVSSGLESYLGYGDWYLEKVPTKSTKELAELYQLSSPMMKVLIDPDKKKKGVLKKIGYSMIVDANKRIKFNLDEVIHLKSPNPDGGVYGKAVLEKNQAVNEMVLRAIVYNSSILRNGGRPPLQLILPEDSDENDADAVMAFYEKNFMGAHNAGKPLVTFAGAEAKNLGITPAEMSYMDLLEFGLKLVAGQYGVPLFMLGFPESTNRSAASDSRRAFYYTRVFPLRKVIANILTREVIEKGLKIEGWKLDFRSAGLEESEATRRDTMQGMRQGAYQWNEGRVRLGLLPIDEPWADKAYLIGSKNDSMLEIEETIGREPDESEPDADQNTSTGRPGEGADEDPEGESKPEEE